MTLKERVSGILEAHQDSDLDDTAQAITDLILDILAPPF